jgi:hypothetical protein
MFPVKQSTALDVLFFAHDANGDAVTGKVTGDWTKRISKNAAAFAAMTVTITERENGWYHLTLDTGHTDTLGVLTLTFTATGVKQVNLQYRVSLTGPDANVIAIDGQLTTGNNATLNLKQLNIVNSAGTALIAESTGSQGSGIKATGHDGGPGINAIGGENASGIHANSGLTSGNGIHAEALGTNGHGFRTKGKGTGEGLSAEGGASGNGIDALGGTNGHGIEALGGATTGSGIRAHGAAGNGLQVSTGSSTGSGLASADFSSTVAADAGNSATAFKTNLTQTENDHWKDAYLRITSGTLRGQLKKVSAYDGTTKIITVLGGFTGVPATGVGFDLVNE